MSSVWSSFTQVKIVIFVHVTIFIQTQETCLMSCLRCNIFTLKQIEPLSITRCRVGFVCVCVYFIATITLFCVLTLPQAAIPGPAPMQLLVQASKGDSLAVEAENMGVCLSFHIIHFRPKEQEFWAEHWVSVHRRWGTSGNQAAELMFQAEYKQVVSGRVSVVFG